MFAEIIVPDFISIQFQNRKLFYKVFQLELVYYKYSSCQLQKCNIAYVCINENVKLIIFCCHFHTDNVLVHFYAPKER